jgi:hypothetical protein
MKALHLHDRALKIRRFEAGSQRPDTAGERAALFSKGCDLKKQRSTVVSLRKGDY